MRVTSVCLGSLATNCYLVETPGGTVLIDPAEAGESLRSFVGDRAIDYVVNTHGHFDHIGGNWEYSEAEVCIHRADLSYVDHVFPEHPTIDRFLTDGEKIVPGLTVLHTPGHSPGSVVLLGDCVLFSGDLLFASSIGRTDLPGGSWEEMASSLRRVLDLPGEYAIYPGHGEATTLERERSANPFLRDLR